MQTTNLFTAAALTVDTFAAANCDKKFGAFIACAALQSAASRQGKLALVRAADDAMATVHEVRKLADDAMALADTLTHNSDFDGAAHALRCAREANAQLQSWIDIEGKSMADSLCVAIQQASDAAKSVSPDQYTSAKNAFMHFRSEITSVTGCLIKADRDGIYTVREPADPRRTTPKKAARAKGQGAQAPMAADMPKADQSAMSIDVIGAALGDTSIEAMLRAALIKCDNVTEFDAAVAAAKQWFISRNSANVAPIKKVG